MKTLLAHEDADRGLRRVAEEIVEHNRGTDKLLLVGIRRGGVPLAARLATLLTPHGEVQVGSVDISLYRDDAGTALPNPRIGPTKLPMAIDGLHVVLVDDVLYTGRTVRAAVDALLDYGRPARVELATLVVRDGRELPIQADYSVKTVEVSAKERVDVIVEGEHFRAVAVPKTHPTTPPPPGSEDNQR